MSNDQDVTDATPGAEANGISQDPIFEKMRLRIVCSIQHMKMKLIRLLKMLQLDNATDTAASFSFENEDHTLGNALRYMLTKE